MPTRAGIATIITGLSCVIAGRIFGVFELYIVAAAILALVTCAVLWVVLNWRSLAVTRSVAPRRLHCGATSTVTLTLENQRPLPTPVAQITDEVAGTTRADAHVPPLRRSRPTRASYRVPTERRGLVPIGPMRTRITDPFGLASVSSTAAPDTSLLVLPRIDVIAAPPQPGGTVAVQIDGAPGRIGPSGEEFSSLRAYTVGDDLRKVHWPSTAKNDELIMRTEQLPEHGLSMIILDVRSVAADPPTFERMVSATASIVIACHERGDTTRLLTTAGIDLVADTQAGFDAMLDTLALVSQAPAERMSLPIRLSAMPAETAVLVVGTNADSLVGTLRVGTAAIGRTHVVRFHGRGARPRDDAPQLRSTSMIDVGADDDFAETWTRSVGQAARIR